MKINKKYITVEPSLQRLLTMAILQLHALRSYLHSFPCIELPNN
jgi:hypothetical protein